MAVKNTKLGGTDLIDGLAGEAVDWNDTFNATITYKDTQTDAAEKTDNTGNWVELKSWTITPTNINSVLREVFLATDLKSNGTGHIGISIAGTNLGTYFYISNGTSDRFFWMKDIGGGVPGYLITYATNTYNQFFTSIPVYITGDTSYTIKIWGISSGVGNAIAIQNETIRVIFTNSLSEQ